MLQAFNLSFFRSDILPEVTNLLVKNEFELLKLLSLLFQMQNILFPLMDDLVFNIDLRLLFGPLDLELLNISTLLLQHRVFVLNPSVKGLKLLTNISKLVLRELDFTLRRCGHLEHLILIVGLLLLDEIDLTSRIFVNLVHSLLVVSLHRPDLLDETVNEFFLFTDGICMVLVLLVDLLSMLFVDGSLGIAELPLLLQLLLLKGLILRGILKHGLRVLVATSICFSLILIMLHLKLPVKLLLNLIFGALHLINLRPDIVLQISLPCLHLLNHLLLLVGRVLVVDGTTAWVTG